MAEIKTGRVVHGGYAFFKEAAPRIEAVVPAGDLPILTRGALHLPLPSTRYWFYNTEPLHVRGKLTIKYRALIDGAERVFDYSEPNLRWYPPHRHIEFCPIQLGTVGPPPDLATCDVDILFYGYLTPRRQQILDALPVTVTVVEAFGAERAKWIRRARTVLCLNAYDDVNGNPFRVFPVLEAGAHAIVEQCQEDWFNRAVRAHTAVAPYAGLVSLCQWWLDYGGPDGA